MEWHWTTTFTPVSFFLIIFIFIFFVLTLLTRLFFVLFFHLLLLSVSPALYSSVFSPVLVVF